MQSYRVIPGQGLGGEITVPGDKSISHRALMLGGVARGTTAIHGFLDSEDCRATLAALQKMGVRCRRSSVDSLEIDGVGSRGLTAPEEVLDLGNSGTAIRLMTGLLAGQGVAAELTGDASLRRRPMDRVAAPLRTMGARIETSDGRAPIRIQAGTRLEGKRHVLPVASAQIKSALLLAALGADGTTEVISPELTRDHTERMLRTMGVPLQVFDDGRRVVMDGPAELAATRIQIPGDLSSAAFFVVGACLSATEPVVLLRVGINPTRDGILTILRLMGARIELENETRFGDEPVADLRVFPGQLNGIEVPPSLVPLAIDELPVLFIAATAARGRTTFTGASELRVKESDRLGAMAKALTAVGARVEETDDGMIIDGSRMHGGTVESEGDHRIAMSFAVAGLVSEAAITIHDTGPVATSFPGFPEVAARARWEIAVAES